jgi:hypothetical protein
MYGGLVGRRDERRRATPAIERSVGDVMRPQPTARLRSGAHPLVHLSQFADPGDTYYYQ